MSYVCQPVTVQCYTPTPIYLPADSGISRAFYRTVTHLPGRPPLEDADYEAYETHAILYDLFISTDGGAVQGVGPPLVNLKAHLLPMTLTVNTGNTRIEIKHRLSQFDRLSCLTFPLPKTLLGASELSIELRFANGFTVKRTVHRQALAPVTLQFTTLQKNNPSTWILDWLRHCQQLGSQRVLFYDNGSDNQPQLLDDLNRANLDLDIVFIHWPYLYGPANSHYNRFCQASQNNHAHLCFGQSQWMAHFDVDEYIVGQSSDSLLPLLNSSSQRTGLLRFDSYWVPRLNSDTPAEIPSVRDFGHRERSPRKRAHKIVLRTNAYKMVKTHNGKLQLGYWRKTLPPNEWAFLHYKALSTNWRDYTVLGATEKFDSALHVKEHRVQRLFEHYDSHD